MGNLQRDVWEGWTPKDFIDVLSDEIKTVMAGKSCRKPFQTKEELINYIVDNQPYYKKPIQEVNEYFTDLYKLKGEIMSKTCDTCVKRFTTNCPNSDECYSLPEKPEWENRAEKGKKLMGFNEYLESLLGKQGKKELLRALKENKAIVITGPSEPTGKTTLAVLLREQGYTVFENGFNNMYEVRLDKPLKECKHLYIDLRR